ncbi:MAG: hypothetical protein SGJ21_12290 [Alphaproteobacteria bacterium]|nr:hypothetical protein [Alphaproteobacteria bacterium]
MRRTHSALAVIALVLASAPALAQESPPTDDNAAVMAFAQSGAITTATPNGVAVAGPIVIAPKLPEDIPPSIHEQIRHLKARLDNAYPDVGDARKFTFIADYLDIDFRRLWNAYHPERPDRPLIEARPIDARPVDRVRPVDPQRVRPAQITRVAPSRPAPLVRPAPVVRPSRPR